MAAVGALLVSSGIALMAAPTPAMAEPHFKQVGICHANESDGHNAYNFQYVGEGAVVHEGHLNHRLGHAGLKTWKMDGTWNGTHHKAGDAKPDFVSDFGEFHLDGNVTAASCPSDATVDPAVAVVTFTDPSCDNANKASYSTEGSEHVTFKLTGTVAPGEHVVVTATAVWPYQFSSANTLAKKPNPQVRVFEHDFTAAVLDCTAVTPAAATFVDPTCTTALAVQTPASDLVTYAVTGSQVAGGTVQVVATLKNSETSHFAEGAVTSWSHTFTVPTGCGTIVSPPAVAPTTQVSPPKAPVKHKAEVKAETVTPSVVHAGMAGTTTDTGLQAGLGLALAGLALMAGAAGLVLVGGGKDDETA